MAGKRIFLYFLFFLAAFVVFLYIRFPGKDTAAYFTRILMEPDSNLRVSIGNVRPALPFHLEFENTEFHFGQDTVIKPDSFAVFPGLLSLFKAEKKFDIQSGLHQGKVEAGLYLKSINPFVFSSAKVSVSDVKINAFNYITNLGDITLNGEMSGDIKFDLSEEQQLKGEGIVLFRKFSAEMKNSFFNTLNIPVVDFSDIQFDLTHQGNVVTIKQCTAKGSIINVTLKGTIEVVSPIKESRLSLSGSILPDSPYLAKFAHTTAVKTTTKDITRDGIRLNITGTFRNPEIGL